MKNYKNIRRRSVQGSVLSAFGFFIILCSFIYGSLKLNKVNDEVRQKNIQLDSLSSSIQVMKDSLNLLNKQIIGLENSINGLSLGKTYIEKGLESYYSGDFKGAIANYDSAIVNYKNNSAAYGLKGQAQIIIRQYSNAEKNLLKSIELDPNRPQPYYSLITLEIKRNNIDNAFEYLNKLLDISPYYVKQIKFIPELNVISTNKKFQLIEKDQNEKLIYVQERLIDLGYYTGKADGFPGDLTYRAILNYQKNKNLRLTGTWDLQTLIELGYLKSN